MASVCLQGSRCQGSLIYGFFRYLDQLKRRSCYHLSTCLLVFGERSSCNPLWHPTLILEPSTAVCISLRFSSHGEASSQEPFMWIMCWCLVLGPGQSQALDPSLHSLMAILTYSLSCYLCEVELYKCQSILVLKTLALYLYPSVWSGRQCWGPSILCPR